MTEHDFRTPDGRNLHVYEAGVPDGALVLVHHGTPGSGQLAPEWTKDADHRGIRLVAFDRPGYAQSDRRPGRSAADNAADAAFVVDSLGGGPFRTWGVSGGGPHALACAALMPERVLSVAVLAGAAPADAPDLNFLAGMGEDNIEEYGAALAGADKLAAVLGPGRDAILADGKDGLVAALDSVLPPVDKAVLRAGFAEFMFQGMASGLRPGFNGWLDDDLALVRPWGFKAADVTAPTLVLQGKQDLMVPYAHGEWLARTLPQAEAVLTEDDGHLSLISAIGQVHAWLLAH